jgi:deoxyribose-phosphate aldolase
MIETELAGYIEHTLLKAEATAADIERLCAEARRYGFLAVCVNGSWVRLARDLIAGSSVMVNSVAGFPLGAMSTEAKRFEAETAVLHGAHEIDVVLHIGRLKQGDDQYVIDELREIVRTAAGRPVKVILETCLLKNDEKIRACRLAVESGASFVKTSTGFSSGGATVEDVKLMRQTVGPDFGIKASGGIRDAKTAIALIEAGATRLGTSAGIRILNTLGAPERSEPRA